MAGDQNGRMWALAAEQVNNVSARAPVGVDEATFDLEFRAVFAFESAGQTEAEIAAARKELDDLVAEAKRKRELTDAELAGGNSGELPGVPKIPSVDELASLADEKLSVTGTFNAAVAERLGTQGNEPVVRVLEEVRELNRQILGEAREGGIVFA